MRIFRRLYNKFFRVDRTADEVIEVLNALQNKTISGEEWDYFISVTIIDPELERVRERVSEMWVENSPYMVPSSLDPTELNNKGIAEIRKLIASIR